MINDKLGSMVPSADRRLVSGDCNPSLDKFKRLADAMDNWRGAELEFKLARSATARIPIYGGPKKFFVMANPEMTKEALAKFMSVGSVAGAVAKAHKAETLKLYNIVTKETDPTPIADRLYYRRVKPA